MYVYNIITVQTVKFLYYNSVTSIVCGIIIFYLFQYIFYSHYNKECAIPSSISVNKWENFIKINSPLIHPTSVYCLARRATRITPVRTRITGSQAVAYIHRAHICICTNPVWYISFLRSSPPPPDRTDLVACWTLVHQHWLKGVIPFANMSAVRRICSIKQKYLSIRNPKSIADGSAAISFPSVWGGWSDFCLSGKRLLSYSTPVRHRGRLGKHWRRPSRCLVSIEAAK